METAPAKETEVPAWPESGLARDIGLSTSRMASSAQDDGEHLLRLAKDPLLLREHLGRTLSAPPLVAARITPMLALVQADEGHRSVFPRRYADGEARVGSSHSPERFVAGEEDRTCALGTAQASAHRAMRSRAVWLMAIMALAAILRWACRN